MGRFYPINWLCALVDVLYDTGVEDLAREAKWLNTKYLRPNIQKTLFEVKDYKPWLRHMKVSLVQLNNQHPHAYEILVEENHRVTAEVLKTANAAAEDGTHPYECIFTSDFDQLNYERLFNERDYTRIYDTFLDMQDEVHWLENVEFPIFVAWKHCRPQDSTGISFDNYLTVRSYVREEIMELITTDDRIVAKACGYDSPIWNNADYVLEVVKQVDDKGYYKSEDYIDVGAELSEADSYEIISQGSSAWSNASTLVHV